MDSFANMQKYFQCLCPFIWRRSLNNIFTFMPNLRTGLVRECVLVMQILLQHPVPIPTQRRTKYGKLGIKPGQHLSAPYEYRQPMPCPTDCFPEFDMNQPASFHAE